MRIGYYTTYYPYAESTPNSKRFPGGGMEVVARELAVNMANRGHEVSVFTTAEEGNGQSESQNGITIHRYPTAFTIATSPFSVQMFKQSHRHDLDLVHVHLAAPSAALTGLVHSRKKHLPLVIGYSGDLVAGFGSVIRRVCTTAYNRLFHNWLLSQAEIIISPSESYVQHSPFLAGHRGKVVVIPHGINLDEYQTASPKLECRKQLDLPKDAPIILFVGWLLSYKGPDVLLRAMKYVIDKSAHAQVLFMGTGAERNALEQMAIKLGIEDNVRFLGYIRDSAIKARYYRAADVFTLPSTLTESFGLVNLEAMASGLPIVASDLGGIPDLVKHGENGYLVPPSNPDALAKAIINILEDHALRERMSKNARERVQRYSWARTTGETEDVYRDIMVRSK
jgi:glycosyltransferase involved in cell wall biosynthesis